MHGALLLLILLATSIVAPAVCAAQAVRVTVRDSLLGVPLAQVLITIQRDGSDTMLHGLTNASGQATITLPSAGRWSVSVRRLGFIPRASVAQVPEGQVTTVSFLTRSVAFTLPAARVVATAGGCARAPESDDRTAALWEQVTLALRATATAARDPARTMTLRAISYDRELDRALRLISERPSQLRRGLGRPFTAADPESLATHGYVRQDAERSLQYFAPDENALLSASFALTHCFDTPPADADPSLAELRFRPAPTQHFPEIAGTAYIDAVSGALRRIVFRFVNASTLFPEGTVHAGGDVSLEQMPDGEWIVIGWSIRMPRMVRVSWARGAKLTGYHEVGGAVDTLNATTVATATMPLVRLMDIPVQTDRSLPAPRAGRQPTGDQVVVGGKLIVATSGRPRRSVDWTRGFADRRRFGVGVFLDSAQLAPHAARPVLDLLPLLGAIELFVVPDGVPAPPRADDVDLTEGWIAGAPLPVMQPAGVTREVTRCHLKLFVDGQRTSAASLRVMQGSTIGGMEFYARSRDVPDGFRRSGNTCGTVLLWSRVDGLLP